MEATIFSDGSSRGNPGPGGWGAIVIIGERVVELGGRENNTTNNRMELTAVLEGVRFAESLGTRKVLVHTDSSYVVNCVSKWLHGWVRNDWQTKDGKSVLNRDILECFYDLLSLIEIDFKLIPGHSGVAANERCDVIATSFADNVPVELFDGKLQDYSVSLSLQAMHKGDLCTQGRLVQKKKTKSKSRAFSYISEVAGVVQIHKTWAECEKRVKGHRARFKKSISKEDEEKILEEFST